MIIVTSFSPNHACKENQIEAFQSWKQYGSCYSLNDYSEKDTLIPVCPLDSKFSLILTHKTACGLFGKSLVNINAMIDFAIEQNQDLLIINSDIILRNLPDFRQDGVTMLSRYDYDTHLEQNEMFIHGYDVFYIPCHLLKLIPQTIYALGLPWWDVWLPFICIRLDIPLYYPEGKFAFHKKHVTQYDYALWERIGEYFKWEVQLQGTVSHVVTKVMAIIKSHWINI